MDSAPGDIRLIVGLGNPGERYRYTWHNIGARTVELASRRLNAPMKIGKGEFLIAETRYNGAPLALMIPTTFMNRSGGPVSAWLNYHKLPSSACLLVYDDHDLPFGRIRLRLEGSSGGHRGMDDVIRWLSDDAFPRLRIGIRTEEEFEELADQVLSPIPRRYEKDVELVLTTAADALETSLKESLTTAMNRYNKMEILTRGD